MPELKPESKFEQSNSSEEARELEAAKVFSPGEELRKIKQLPEEKRKAAFEKYKEKLAWQKEGIAEMQAFLIAAIQGEPDISLEELEKIAEDFGKKFELDDRQKLITKTILRIYFIKHRKVKEARERYPDDKELFRAVFGREPKGDIQVIEGPMMLYFRCHNLEDYTLIRTEAFLENRDVTPEEMAVANMSGGVSITTSRVKSLERTIAAKNAQGELWDSGARGIYRHEEQHQMNRLFNLEREKMSNLEEFREAENEEKRKFALERYSRANRQSFLRRAKSELLAHFKEGSRSAREIFDVLTKPKQEGGLYDYFADGEAIMQSSLEGELGEQHVALIGKSLDKVFRIEYNGLLFEGINAFERLRDEFKSRGGSVDEAIGVLINEPLEKWPKVVRRLIEVRYNK